MKRKVRQRLQRRAVRLWWRLLRAEFHRSQGTRMHLAHSTYRRYARALRRLGEVPDTFESLFGVVVGSTIQYRVLVAAKEQS